MVKGSKKKKIKWLYILSAIIRTYDPILFETHEEPYGSQPFFFWGTSTYFFSQDNNNYDVSLYALICCKKNFTIQLILNVSKKKF